MGLDMYFNVRKGKCESEYRNTAIQYPEELQQLYEVCDTKRIITNVDYQIGYFRKFNALHNYIVHNFADGVDSCQEISLDHDAISQILQTLIEVQKYRDQPELIKQIMPPAKGFFFGGTEIDEYYFDDVEMAIRLFTIISKTIDFEQYRVIYQASW